MINAKELHNGVHLAFVNQFVSYGMVFEISTAQQQHILNGLSIVREMNLSKHNEKVIVTEESSNELFQSESSHEPLLSWQSSM